MDACIAMTQLAKASDPGFTVPCLLELVHCHADMEMKCRVHAVQAHIKKTQKNTITQSATNQKAPDNKKKVGGVFYPPHD